ncbi:transporter substrate-binding domain-containing protein [Sulfurospirillum halorespirans]|uniref:Putative diguanylate cyclase n=1 Tax=Sulfurospirillum halorespirans DSM 13726 TaxID=1193502 RepID=A0A1D7TH76_9BACT|nr:transporter substrate-binding domain-containing protein [Sulfurospirillum halorespirans]AOO64326.1 putative diguanylate cyclase [Sulfurospirillum halorespirans DSM 13726]
MKAVISLFFILLSFITFLQASAIDMTPSEQAWLDKTKTLRVRVTKDLPPYQFIQDGEYAGISVEYIKFFASTFNLAIEYVTDGSWAEALERVQTHDGIDVILRVTPNAKLSQTMLFSKVYSAFPFSLLTPNGINSENFFGATPRSVAIVPSYMVNEKLKQDYPHFRYITYPNSLEAMRAVNEHKVDGFVGDIAMMSMFVKNYHLTNVKISHFSNYMAEEQSVAVAKDWPEFISLFNKMLTSMPSDLHVKIKRKYLPLIKEEQAPFLRQEIELSASEKAYIAAHPSISVTNELGWYPYDFNEEGEARGFSVDYLRLLGKKIGVHFNFVSDTWPNLYERFQNKEIMMAQPLIPSVERRQNFRFSDKFITMDLALITQIKRQDITSIETLNGKTVGAGKGWPTTKYLKDEHPELTVVEYETTKEMLEAIAFGLIDAGMDDAFTANYIIEKEMLSNLHVVSKIELQNLEDKNLYIVMQPEDETLQTIINKALRSVRPEELDALKSKWLKSILPKEERLAFSLDEQLYLAQKKRITLCINPDQMPLEMNQKGKHVGIVADYIHEMEQFIGIPIEVVQTQTWTESLRYAKERTCDILSLAIATPERKTYLNFTHAYMQIPLVLVSSEDKVFYSDIGQLVGKPIGLTKGYAFGEILKVRYPNIHFVDVNNDADGLKQVEQKKLFGFIGTLVTVAYQIQKEYYGSLKIVSKLDDKLDLSVATRSDEPLLHSIFEKAVNSIDSAKKQTILNQWVSINVEDHLDYTYIYMAMGFIGILILIVLIRQHQLKKYNAQLEILSSTDKLTGIHNRLKLDDILEYEKKMFDRDQLPLCIILFDLDYFKHVNDNYGHKRGDEVLKSIAKIVTHAKREMDVFGRWGGEEFLLICHNTDIEGAKILAEKLRLAIASYEFPEIVSLTASFGVAQFEKYDSIVKVFDKADQALYEAKEQGRNRVV